MRALLSLAIVACLAGPAAGQATSKPTTETASQFYLRYRALVAKATSLPQIVEHWSSDQRQDFNAAPPSERPDLEFVKSSTAATQDVKVVKEASTPNFATLDVQGVQDGRPVTTTVDLVREKGVWKIASGPERWR